MKEFIHENLVISTLHLELKSGSADDFLSLEKSFLQMIGIKIELANRNIKRHSQFYSIVILVALP